MPSGVAGVVEVLASELDELEPQPTSRITMSADAMVAVTVFVDEELLHRGRMHLQYQRLNEVQIRVLRSNLRST